MGLKLTRKNGDNIHSGRHHRLQLAAIRRSELNVRKLGLLTALLSATKALLELVNTSSGVHKALLTSKERMAGRANTNVQVRHS